MLSYTLILLKRFGPGCGYYPDPSKIVFIMHPENIEAGKVLACVTGLKCAQARATLTDLLGAKISNLIG